MNAFPSLRIEGGFFSPDLVENLLQDQLPGQKAPDFGLPRQRDLTAEIAAVYHDARSLWLVFRNRLEGLPEDNLATSETRTLWVMPLMRLLGYDLEFQSRAFELDGLTFAISHILKSPPSVQHSTPMHIVGWRQELGRIAPSGRPRLSPHALVQEYLNRSEALWGIVTNGRILRLLRDSTSLRRQAYLEFDLEGIFEQERFADFVLLYRLLHRTRLPMDGRAEDCWLEKYYQQSIQQGGRVRDHLREGVEQCLTILANGFLAHPRNGDLRGWVQREGAPALYRQLLRLVYRFLFLLVSEERGLMGQPPLYLNHYGISRLRRLVENRSAYTEDTDLWHGLCALWKIFQDEELAALLGVPPLNGELFAHQVLDEAFLSNRDLLTAFRYLCFYDTPPRRVNYAALDTEELGSVYESLLELHPLVDQHSNPPVFFMEMHGEERRSTGSHYTPPELVTPIIQHALEPVLKERLSACQSNQEKEIAILNLKVLDPACGSGHFLLAAARRLGKELARVRTGEDEPAPEPIHLAVRDVITHCIYGVDKNPLAVELCRVSLWLESNAGNKPLTFLEHHIRHGDSLLGLSNLHALEGGIPDQAFTPLGNENRTRLATLKRYNAQERQMRFFQYGFVTQALEKFVRTMQSLAAMPEATLEQVRAKRNAYQKAKNTPEYERLQLACDAYIAAFFHPLTTSAVQEALSRGALPTPQLGAEVEKLRTERVFFHWALEFAEVFAKGGFDVILGNPPFMGGLKISGNFGEAYRNWLEYACHPFGGTADLCAAFFRRGFTLLKPGGRLGMIATNTLGQGDTRESGLKVILARGGRIAFARRFVKWPGQANVEVNLVVISRPSSGSLSHPAVLDGGEVPAISSRLDAELEAEPVRLTQNEGKAFQGDIVRSMGFVLEAWEAEHLLAQDPRNADCLFPYLNGEDLNSHPEQQPSRWVICFHDWSLERAREYPDLLRIVEERVKPERERLTGPGDKRNREYWWQFGAYRAGLRRAIAPLRRVLVRALTSEFHMMVFVPRNYIFSHALGVFALDDDYHFALLQSSIHEAWVWQNASSLESRNRYTPTDCFDTFPFPRLEYERLAGGKWHLEAMPQAFQQAAQVGAAYHEHRRQVMLARQLGLTKTYNLFHNPACQDADIVRLRELHAEMDRAVLACYGWDDLDPGHGFYQNDRGQTRFTLSPKVRREVLARLVALNLEMARTDNFEPPSLPVRKRSRSKPFFTIEEMDEDETGGD